MKIPNHPLFEKLRSLQLPESGWAIFGSGPLWVRGIRESTDIDIIVNESLWEWAKTNGKYGVKEDIGLEYVQFSNGDIEVYRDWHPGEWNVDELIDTAEIVDGIPFVKLEYVIDWKKKKGREKDVNDLRLIDKYLKNGNAKI